MSAMGVIRQVPSGDVHSEVALADSESLPQPKRLGIVLSRRFEKKNSQAPKGASIHKKDTETPQRQIPKQRTKVSG
jgi:hypothetical protein